MAHIQSGDAYWVMWIGKRQWEGLPGEFDVGQPGWVFATDESLSDEAVDLFIFAPAFGSESAWPYTVSCGATDFLRFTTLENV